MSRGGRGSSRVLWHTGYYGTQGSVLGFGQEGPNAIGFACSLRANNNHHRTFWA